jgi:hypothetical protein
MNRKTLIIILALIGVVVGAFALTGQNQTSTDTQRRAPAAQQPVRATQPQSSQAEPVPAHYETTPSLGSLAPTLRPEQFTGMTREAYRVAGEIPQTLAQLPCYCHCDQSFGHKSLQSCFVDDHAAHCAVCVNEALAANQLQKQGLTPAQIRDRIVAEYSQE